MSILNTEFKIGNASAPIHLFGLLASAIGLDARQRRRPKLRAATMEPSTLLLVILDLAPRVARQPTVEAGAKQHGPDSIAVLFRKKLSRMRTHMKWTKQTYPLRQFVLSILHFLLF
jgi:hypothetical protein